MQILFESLLFCSLARTATTCQSQRFLQQTVFAFFAREQRRVYDMNWYLVPLSLSLPKKCDHYANTLPKLWKILRLFRKMNGEHEKIR